MAVDKKIEKKLRLKILHDFKRKGLILRTDAINFLVETLSKFPEDEWAVSNKKVLESIHRESLSSAVVDLAAVQQAVKQCIAEADGFENIPSADTVVVVSAFSVPQLFFDIDRQIFLPTKTKPKLYADSTARAAMFRERYTIMLQRLQRHPLFSPPLISTTDKQVYYKLMPIDSLKGMDDVEQGSVSSQSFQITILGMLSQLEEGAWFVEDLSGSIRLDLSQCKATPGLYTETCMVLVQGQCVDAALQVSMLAHPPAEPRQTTKAVFKNVNFFGGPSIDRDFAQLKAKEEHDANSFFVTMSDVWLDKPEVMGRLKTLFEGYAAIPPTAFIFIGNFCSVPYGPRHATLVKEGLSQLGRLAAQHPQLAQQSMFIFVPGPLDPGAANIVPRPPLPSTLTADLLRSLPNAIFTTNPARVRYCTQEIVVFREDLTDKLCRHSVLPPSTADGLGLSHQLVRTVLDQGYLTPLTMNVRPVYWGLDSTLRLYPLPDVLILADQCDQFDLTYESTLCFNPGPLLTSGFAFFVYWPADRRCDYSQIPDGPDEDTGP